MPASPSEGLLDESPERNAYDRELVKRFQDGDSHAFWEIMQYYQPKIQALSLSLLRNKADAEEITQDTFIRAHRGLERFQHGSSLSVWLQRIAINLARNRHWYFFRKRRTDLPPEGSDMNSDTSAE